VIVKFNSQTGTISLSIEYSVREQMCDVNDYG